MHENGTIHKSKTQQVFRLVGLNYILGLYWIVVFLWHIGYYERAPQLSHGLEFYCILLTVQDEVYSQRWVFYHVFTVYCLHVIEKSYCFVNRSCIVVKVIYIE